MGTAQIAGLFQTHWTKPHRCVEWVSRQRQATPIWNVNGVGSPCVQEASASEIDGSANDRVQANETVNGDLRLLQEQREHSFHGTLCHPAF